MFRLSLVFWLTWIVAQPVYAGAWLREKGKGFLAYSNLTARSLDTTYNAYLDFGLRENLTLGATLDVYSPLGLPVTGKGLIFMRRSLDWGRADANWAYELGIGARYTGVKFVPVAKTTLSYGRGINWGKRSGWFAVNTGVEWDLGFAQHVVKIDTTLGLELGERSKGMLQFYNTFGQNWSSVTIAPSYVFQTKKKKNNYVVGLEANSLVPNNVAFKFGVWQSF